jgi:hypothetical protein
MSDGLNTFSEPEFSGLAGSIEFYQHGSFPYFKATNLYVPLITSDVSEFPFCNSGVVYQCQRLALSTGYSFKEKLT